MKASLVVLVSCQCFWLALLLRQLSRVLNALAQKSQHGLKSWLRLDGRSKVVAQNRYEFKPTKQFQV